ncbi:hypothetical protein GCM10022226_16530 [Sphaerisporangium flaviroseum]|uniref:Uncharacterized protein n=1 Tax=Sphaerisporangium flaviroseum TaxID=509199 RepID=A0ABP7HRD0_9ACTN
MRTVTVAVWLVTAGFGIYLLSLWLAGGGLRQQKTKVTRFPTALIFMHPALGVSSLGSWVAFVLTARGGYIWLSLGLLCLAALLGFAMFTRWIGGGRHARGAEQGFPVLAVILHGLSAVVTFILVLLAATTM